MKQRLLDSAAALGIALTTAQADSLLAYLALLGRWNRVYNLTALREPDRMLSHHLVDCLATLAPLRRHAGGRPMRVLDVGSGGGLPGVVLAIMEPGWSVVCVDAVAKKAGFILQAGAELGLRNLKSIHSRVEVLPGSLGRFDLIVSRAFASLSDFAALSARLLADGGVWVAMKGQPSPAELSALPPQVDMFHVEPLRLPGLDEHRCLVWMRPRAKL